MKADILQILHEEAMTQYNPDGKDERVVNSDEFDTVSNQIVNLFKDRKYTEEDIRKAILYGQTTKNIDYHDDFIQSLNKQYNEQLCECSSKILPNGKIQLHLCKKCNEELFKES